MRATRLAFAIVSAFPCILLAASCVQGPESPRIDRPSIETLDDERDLGVSGTAGGDTARLPPALRACALRPAQGAEPPSSADGSESVSRDPGVEAQESENGERVGETTEAFGKVIHCQDDESSADCMQRCAEEGIACAPQRRHPHNSGAGMGELFACADIPHSCVYSYPNGDRCWFVTTLLFPVCRYVGGSP